MKHWMIYAATPFLSVALAAGSGNTQGSASEILRARIDAYAQGLVMTPMCEKLGYKRNDVGARRTSQLVVAAALEAGLATGKLEKAVGEASDRAFRTFNMQMVASTETKTPEADKALVERAAEVCGRMAQTQDGAALVTAPPGYDRKVAVAAFVDELLESSGRASWQTPQIVATGKFLYDLGRCSKVLEADKVQALAEPYLRKPTVDDASVGRAQIYYQRTYDLGIRAAGWSGMSKEQCAILTSPGSPGSSG